MSMTKELRERLARLDDNALARYVIAALDDRDHEIAKDDGVLRVWRRRTEVAEYRSARNLSGALRWWSESRRLRKVDAELTDLVKRLRRKVAIYLEDARYYRRQWRLCAEFELDTIAENKRERERAEIVEGEEK